MRHRGRQARPPRLPARPRSPHRKKILISGGGRCNFTNLYCAPENFISANPHFAKSALARYTPADFMALVAKHSIAYHEKTLGQLFCDGSAQQILAMLAEECRRAASASSLELKSARFRGQGISSSAPIEMSCSTRAGFGHRRAFDSEDGRHRIWLRTGASIRAARTAVPSGAGSAVSDAGSGTLVRSCRSLARRRRCHRAPALCGKNAHHPSRPQRSGYPSSLLYWRPPEAVALTWHRHRKSLPYAGAKRWPRSGFGTDRAPQGLPARFADRWLEAKPAVNGAITPLPSWNAASITGRSFPRTQRAMRKPRSLPEGWIPS